MVNWRRIVAAAAAASAPVEDGHAWCLRPRRTLQRRYKNVCKLAGGIAITMTINLSDLRAFQQATPGAVGRELLGFQPSNSDKSASRLKV